jgi:hypothetical protein
MAGRKLHGKNAAIYINGVKVTNKTEWTLSMARDYADVSTFRDANKVYAAGLMDISGTFAGLLDVDGDALVSSNTGSAVTVAVYAREGEPAVASGPAYVDASVTASVSDAVRCSGTFKAAGAWAIG